MAVSFKIHPRLDGIPNNTDSFIVLLAVNLNAPQWEEHNSKKHSICMPMQH